MHHWATDKDVDVVKKTITSMGFKPVAIPGAERTAIGIIGNQGWVDDAPFKGNRAIMEILHVPCEWRGDPSRTVGFCSYIIAFRMPVHNYDVFPF